MIIDSEPLDNIITSISPKEAYSILNIQATFDKTVIQMNYHNLVSFLQDEMEYENKFAELRVAYEVLLIYIENPKKIDSIEQPIDVSYLSEGIKNLSLLQGILARRIRASEREEEFWYNYYAKKEAEEDNEEDNEEENEEANSNAELNDDEYEVDEDDIEIPDFGYPDREEAHELLKKIENLHFKDNKGDYSGILAEAYYQMMTEARIPLNSINSTKWHQWKYNYAKKALDTDDSRMKDVEYLYMCGAWLAKSDNIDSIKQAIGYLLEVEKRAQGTLREKNAYDSLSQAYYSIDDYRNALIYARKLIRCAPERTYVYRIIGKAAYSQLEVSCNRMYADEAANAFLMALKDKMGYWNTARAVEMLCNICTRIRNWAMLEKLCGKEEDTILHGFPYHYYMGVALMNTKRAKEAAKHFHNALEINSERFIQTIYANLSRCYEEIDYDKACEYMRKFQQFEFNDINYPKECMMHFFLRKKKYEEAKRSVESFYGIPEILNLIKFRIDICQAGTDDERKNVIEQLREYMPDIQKREKLSEKNGYHVKRGSLWTEKNACTIGDTYWFILKDDEMAIRYYELSIELVNYWLGLSEKVKDSKYKDANRKASYAHYMLTRIYGELGNKKKMQKHADAYMDYIREYYSDDDTKSIEEQYITALDDYAIRGLIKNADYIYIKASGEMGTESSGDYNACKLARYYIAMGKTDEARQLAVRLAKKYRKKIPALLYVVMGDLARVSGNRIRAERMYRLALDKNPWEAYEGLRYL